MTRELPSFLEHGRTPYTSFRNGAERAIRRAQREHFGLLTVKPPFERVARFRPFGTGEPVLVSRETHATRRDRPDEPAVQRQTGAVRAAMKDRVSRTL
ncbi:MAG: hypothetical protein ACYC35_02240 [Pirellulales bacterium]